MLDELEPTAIPKPVNFITHGDFYVGKRPLIANTVVMWEHAGRLSDEIPLRIDES